MEHTIILKCLNFYIHISIQKEKIIKIKQYWIMFHHLMLAKLKLSYKIKKGLKHFREEHPHQSYLLLIGLKKKLTI